MKKFMSLLAAGMMVVSLTGCMKKSEKPYAKKEYKSKYDKKQVKKSKPVKKDDKKRSYAKKESRY